MEEVNLSVLRLMEQSKLIAQQLLRVSEDLELAHEKYPYWSEILKITNSCHNTSAQPK